MNKQELIEKLNLTYSWLEHMISGLSDEEISNSIPHKDRSAKDILAHIAAWNQHGITWIEAIARGERPALPMEGHSIEERSSVFAGINEEIHKENLDKSAREVLSDHTESWKSLMTLVERLTEEDLNRTFQFDWMPNQIQGWQVVAWRLSHADNHGKQIEAWLRQIRETRE